MAERLNRSGGASGDIELMHLGDCALAPTIENGNGIKFVETDEKFEPAAFLNTETLVSGDTAGTIIGAFRAYDLAGSLLGYVMVYDGITTA